jgi:hypothetical protein
MATLHEYFLKDGAQNLTTYETWEMKNESGEKLGEVIASLHFDFEAYAKYASFYVPEI